MTANTVSKSQSFSQGRSPIKFSVHISYKKYGSLVLVMLN